MSPNAVSPMYFVKIPANSSRLKQVLNKVEKLASDFNITNPAKGKSLERAAIFSLPNESRIAGEEIMNKAGVKFSTIA